MSLTGVPRVPRVFPYSSSRRLWVAASEVLLRIGNVVLYRLPQIPLRTNLFRGDSLAALYGKRRQEEHGKTRGTVIGNRHTVVTMESRIPDDANAAR